MFTETITYPVAFLAGLLSFFSPCVLPLIPAYFVFITGLSADEITKKSNTAIKKKVVFSTIAYVSGFSFVFILLGASASLIGATIAPFSNVIEKIGGFLIIIFGLNFMGVIKFSFLNSEKKIHIKNNPLNFLWIFAIGMAFAAGWSPCIGPILGSVLILAGNESTLTSGAILLGVYSFGLALPFIILSFFINFIFIFVKKTNKFLKYISFISGAFLIIVGILLLIGKFSF